MNARTQSVMRGKVSHVVLDPRTLAVMFLRPEIQLVLLAYAATSNVGHAAADVWDQDRLKGAGLDVLSPEVLTLATEGPASLILSATHS